MRGVCMRVTRYTSNVQLELVKCCILFLCSMAIGDFLYFQGFTEQKMEEVVTENNNELLQYNCWSITVAV